MLSSFSSLLVILGSNPGTSSSLASTLPVRNICRTKHTAFSVQAGLESNLPALALLECRSDCCSGHSNCSSPSPPTHTDRHPIDRLCSLWISRNRLRGAWEFLLEMLNVQAWRIHQKGIGGHVSCSPPTSLPCARQAGSLVLWSSIRSPTPTWWAWTLLRAPTHCWVCQCC